CCGGRENSEAPTAVRIEAWGARSSTSTLGLGFVGDSKPRASPWKASGGGGLLWWLKDRGKGKNEFTSSRQTRWRKGLACRAVEEEIGQWQGGGRHGRREKARFDLGKGVLPEGEVGLEEEEGKRVTTTAVACKEGQRRPALVS
uniref:DUF834 domain-containing protein n=1 Tax=Oryza glumipatula TaxID=40148 RepID=A0A0D9ZMR4_9ORYZ